MIGEYLDPTVVAVPGFLVLLWWEVGVARRRKAAGDDVLGYSGPDTRASVLMGLGSILTVGLLNLAVFALAEWLWQWRVTDLGNGVLGWVVAMIGWDLAYYWLHRFEHVVRILWAAHENHHSSQLFNLSTALRQPWTPVGVLVAFPSLALLGVRPWMIMVAGGFNLIYQYWVHTELIGRLPRWFEAVFNTPSHHRVHHGSNPQYLDRNYGGILILWDRLFGSFEPEDERVRYGLTKNIERYDVWHVAFHEYGDIAGDLVSAERWRDRIGFLVAHPGWLPPGATRQ